MTTFLRRDWSKYSKFSRRKKQKWRNPTGRHNKMRNKIRGKPAVVSIGYRKNKTVRGKINGKTPFDVKNIADLKMMEKNQIAILGKIGTKKKLEVLKMAKEMSIEVYGTSLEKTMKKVGGKK